MTAKARNTKRANSEIPTLDDVASGAVTLDEYEIAHGEDIPEWTEEDFRRARPMREMFPELVEALERARGQRGPQKAPTKERVSLRLDRDIVESYRAGGPGWQTRINNDLAELQKRKKHG
jgi:uncharacterized protein (DUF4415 family)